MTENINEGKERRSTSVLSRKIGVGLTRINLSPGLRETSQRGLGRETTLSTPTKVRISGDSLGTSRLTSDRYSSGYNRLGGNKNTSAPNVYLSSGAKLPSDKELGRNNFDISGKYPEGQLRKNFSAANTSELLNEEKVTSTTSVQRSQSANRGYYSTYSGTKANTLGSSKELLETRSNNGGDFTENDSYILKKSVENKLESDTSDTKYPGIEKSRVENYDLDLEQDEEDVTFTPDANMNTGSRPIQVDVKSPHSPSKDSGYHSPRVETDVDSFSTSLCRSRSREKRSTSVTEHKIEPELVPETPKVEKVPERPVRTKSASRKRSTEQLRELSTLDSSPRRPQADRSLGQGQNDRSLVQGQIDTDVVPKSNFENLIDSKSVNDETKQDLKSADWRVLRGQDSYELPKSDTDGGLNDSVADNDTPIARPRSHRSQRRLTRRSISFKKLEDDEYIGFASLPEQVHRKAVRRGFEFTLMVVGETGLGKSTLINSLFLMDLYKDRKVTNIEERVQKTVELEKKELEIEERGVKLKLTIVDTPGFNDAVNAEESWKPIVNYIDSQFNGYFTAESGLNRKNIQDTRVHCCLYFISPYGHGLRPVDIMVMKKLHHKVNIIPLIAKSDMLTKPECKRLKEKVLSEIKKHNIQIYQYPDCDSDEDEEFKQQDVELKKSIPFAVVGSNTVVEAGGKKIRGRMYPWGIVEVENPVHSDFIKLRQMLISTHMQDLKDVTCDVHYENYRAEHISEQMTTGQRERGKLKRDSVANLEHSLETEKLLQEKEAEIKRMQEMLAKMQAQLQNNSPRLNGKVGHV